MKKFKECDRYIEETNHWSDIFWSVDGENNLGKILMGIRSKI